jgi:hypothetical protein
LCAAVGTDTTAVYDALASELRSVGYTPVLVRLSELMTQLPGLEYLLNLHDEDRRISESQRAGNEIRRILKHGDAVVRLALSALHSKRASLNDSQDATVPAERHCFIISSLKRDEELEMLRQLFGQPTMSRRFGHDDLASDPQRDVHGPSALLIGQVYVREDQLWRVNSDTAKQPPCVYEARSPVKSHIARDFVSGIRRDGAPRSGREHCSHP